MFTSEMGCPSILKMALCDLNLGLHKNILTFNAARNTTFGFRQGNNTKLQIKKGYTLATCASINNHETLQNLVNKLTGKKAIDINSSNQVFIRKRNPNIELWSYKDSNDNYYVIATTDERKKILAFSKDGKNIYFAGKDF